MLEGPRASEFELINAAHADSMSYHDFRLMDTEYQRLLLAHYHVSQRMEAVSVYQQNKKARRR